MVSYRRNINIRLEVFKMEKRKVNFLMNDKMISELDDIAVDMGTSRSSLIVMILRQYLDQRAALAMGNQIQEIMELVRKEKENMQQDPSC